LNVVYDDGVVVYLNGTEVHRGNMPAAASHSHAGAPWLAKRTPIRSRSILRSCKTNANVLAVEIHQANGTSTDISFDAQLVASTNTLQLTRWSVPPNRHAVEHRRPLATNAPSNSQVTYGSVQRIWSERHRSRGHDGHVVTLSGLSANTRYYYAWDPRPRTVAGGDANHSFVTSPALGTTVPTRIWVLGDSGTADANAQAVRNAYYSFAGSTQPNLWLMLGDNAYESGLDSEYQAAVFKHVSVDVEAVGAVADAGQSRRDGGEFVEPVGPVLRHVHAAESRRSRRLCLRHRGVFLVRLRNIHFINLESFETDRSATADDDVAAERRELDDAEVDCRVLASPALQQGLAQFRHRHRTGRDAAERLPILEAAGVDLVPQRTQPRLRTIVPDRRALRHIDHVHASMKKDGGSGRLDGTGAYHKPTAGKAPHEGAVYTVAGSSGQASGGTLNHPAMFISLNLLGSMVLDVNDLRLDAKFIDNTGTVRDYFTIEKGSTAPPLAITTSTLPGGTVVWRTRSRWPRQEGRRPTPGASSRRACLPVWH
jgi:hypothetical protein